MGVWRIRKGCYIMYLRWEASKAKCKLFRKLTYLFIHAISTSI